MYSSQISIDRDCQFSSDVFGSHRAFLLPSRITTDRNEIAISVESGVKHNLSAIIRVYFTSKLIMNFNCHFDPDSF